MSYILNYYQYQNIFHLNLQKQLANIEYSLLKNEYLVELYLLLNIPKKLLSQLLDEFIVSENINLNDIQNIQSFLINSLYDDMDNVYYINGKLELLDNNDDTLNKYKHLYDTDSFLNIYNDFCEEYSITKVKIDSKENMLKYIREYIKIEENNGKYILQSISEKYEELNIENQKLINIFLNLENNLRFALLYRITKTNLENIYNFQNFFDIFFNADNQLNNQLYVEYKTSFFNENNKKNTLNIDEALEISITKIKSNDTIYELQNFQDYLNLFNSIIDNQLIKYHNIKVCINNDNDKKYVLKLQEFKQYLYQIENNLIKKENNDLIKINFF